MGLSVQGAELLGSGIGAVSSGVGGLFSGLFNANQAKKNRAFQERMYNKQVEDNLKFWNLQNEYDLPSAQLQRLRDAGINPLIAWANGGLQNVANSAIQSGTAPHGAQASTNFNTRFEMANLALVKAQQENLQADRDLKESEAEKNRETTAGIAIQNYINNTTRNLLIAYRYRDFDLLNSTIAKNNNEIFQSSQMNGTMMAAQSLANYLSIKHYNLQEYQVGNNVLQGWENVISNRISANAQMKSAFAQTMNAVNAAKLVPYQIGVMRATAQKILFEADFLKKSMPSRLTALELDNKLKIASRNNITWEQVLKESHIDLNQSQKFLNYINGNAAQSAMETREFDTYLMGPARMLLPFGAPQKEYSMPMNGYSMPSYSY